MLFYNKPAALPAYRSDLQNNFYEKHLFINTCCNAPKYYSHGGTGE